MEKPEEKVNDIKVKEAKIIKPKVSKPIKSKPKFKTEKHKLLVDVTIGDKLVKKGTMYPLTDKGAASFKSKFYIK